MNTKINETLLKNCKEGDLEGIQYCIKAGADVNYRSDDEGEDEEYFLPIDYAVFSGNRDAVQCLIDNDVFVSEICMMESISRKDKEMVALLLKNNLGDMGLSVVFDSLSINMRQYPDDEKLREIAGLITNTLSHLLKLAYISKKIINDPDSFNCSIIDDKA